MKASDIISTEPINTIFGKSTGNYRATLRGTEFKADSTSRDLAIIALKTRLAGLSKYDGWRKYFHTNGGEVLCLYFTFHGWAYDISRNDGKMPSQCVFGSHYTEKEAIASVENHVRQFNEDHERRKI